MGLRNTTKKLAVKKETLRKLQLRTLNGDELQAAAGGMSGSCSMDHCAPSTAQGGC